MLGDFSLFIKGALWFICLVFVTTQVDAFACKFPNEGCRVNRECCSGKCVDAHPGTNPRCTRLSLRDKCLYTYQCDDRLRCGANNTCCSKYWGICTKKEDCCDPQHSCFETDGFYYKRCLYANAGGNRIGFKGNWMPEYHKCIRVGLHGRICTIASSLMLSLAVVVVVSVLCAVTTGYSLLMVSRDMGGGSDCGGCRGCGKSGCDCFKVIDDADDLHEN